MSFQIFLFAYDSESRWRFVSYICQTRNSERDRFRRNRTLTAKSKDISASGVALNVAHEHHDDHEGAVDEGENVDIWVKREKTSVLANDAIRSRDQN